MHEKKMQKVEGLKFDSDKPAFDLWSPYAIEETAKVLTFGAKKYEAHNWMKGISYSRVFAALLRHLWSWWRGHHKDEESNLHPLAHAMCCLMFLLHYEMLADQFTSFDDRPQYEME
jgi:hypothetical protein